MQGNKTASFKEKINSNACCSCRVIKDYGIFIPFSHSSLLVISVFLIKTLTFHWKLLFTCKLASHAYSLANHAEFLEWQQPLCHWATGGPTCTTKLPVTRVGSQTTHIRFQATWTWRQLDAPVLPPSNFFHLPEDSAIFIRNVSTQQ